VQAIVSPDAQDAVRGRCAQSGQSADESHEVIKLLIIKH
jgi:hypothetical protein